MGTRLLLLHVREADNRAAKRNCVLHEGPLPCPVCTVHSLFEISDVKMFVERDSILFSCCFHVVFSVLFPFF